MNTVTIGTYRAHRNTRCVHCGHVGFSSEFPDEPARHPSVCCHCRAAGRTMQTSTTPEPATPDTISWGGHVVGAPGFSEDQFERAMARAFADDLRVKQLHDGAYVVHHPGTTNGYRVTRERCTCKAGEVGTPCKHRAVLIAHLDIREPHTDREWRKLAPSA